MSRELPSCGDLTDGSVSKLLPPPMQAGLFASIGWGLYALSYETLGVELAFDAATLEWSAAALGAAWAAMALLRVDLAFKATLPLHACT